MGKKVIFHVGDRKTGTTSIQNVLRNHQYETNGSELEMIHVPNISHTLWAEPFANALKRKWKRLKAGIDGSKADTVIVSDENFEIASPNELKDVVEKFLPEYLSDSEIIAYVRPHADRVLSSYVQRTKFGDYSGTLEDFHTEALKRNEFMYTPRFTKWQETFGPAFHLKVMSRRLLFRKDVVSDFFHNILAEQEFRLKDEVAESNTSLSLRDLMAMKVFHAELEQRIEKFPALRDCKRQLTRFLLSRLTDEGAQPRLHASLVSKIMADYREDAAAMDDRFFVGAPMSEALKRAPSKAVEQAQSCDPADHLSAREIGQIRSWTELVCLVLSAGDSNLHSGVRKSLNTLVSQSSRCD